MGHPVVVRVRLGSFALISDVISKLRRRRLDSQNQSSSLPTRCIVVVIKGSCNHELISLHFIEVSTFYKSSLGVVFAVVIHCEPLVKRLLLLLFKDGGKGLLYLFLRADDLAGLGRGVFAGVEVGRHVVVVGGVVC